MDSGDRLQFADRCWQAFLRVVEGRLRHLNGAPGGLQILELRGD